jgi:hypothetical protein
MNSELNKILGRDFFIGFFLPSLFFLGANWVLLQLLGHPLTWPKLEGDKIFEGAALAGLAVWIFAIFLQALNRPLFRFTEGYWPKKFWYLFTIHQRKRHKTLSDKLISLRHKWNNSKDNDPALSKELEACWRESVIQYPSREELVLPTTFGNVVRAYEDYSRVLYGFESIQGWCRLQAYMSKPFREVLGRDRAQVDLWLNMCFLSVLVAVEVFAFCWWWNCATFVWLGASMFLLALVAYVQARDSAEQYGEQVKAAFDVYLPALARTLGYNLSCDPDVNKEFWKTYSYVMVYHDEESLDSMATVRLTRATIRQAEDKESAGGSDGTDED